MVQIHHPRRHQEQASLFDTMSIQYHPHVIFFIISATKPVWHNKLGKNPQKKVKSAILGVSVSFRMALWCGLSIDTLDYTSLIIQQQLQGYNVVDPNNKHQKEPT